MTHTDPTAAALLRAILLRPADDTARLVFADWLDDHARKGACPKCTREGIPAVRQAALRVGCGHCHGTGTVSDGFAERAEFIRVQCELERSQRGDLPITEGLPLFARQRKLLTDARRAEWGGIKCPMCGGDGKVLGTGSRHSNPCPRCAGTGFAPVEFRRGFVERVWCRMGDVLRWSNSEAWTLTPWAAGVLAAHPVTAWEITDLPANIAVLPQPAYRAACAIDPNPGTREREVEVIALAVARVARRLAGLPEVTP